MKEKQIKEELEQVNIMIKELEELNECLNERLNDNIKINDVCYKKEEMDRIKEKVDIMKESIKELT